MSSGDDKGGTPVADLVLSGEQQAGAAAINDFVFMAEDISNAYLITTTDGDVMINTGFLTTGERNWTWLAPHRTGPLRAIVLTQHHADHLGGLDSFREDGTQVIVHRNFLPNWADSQRLQAFFGPRTAKLWGAMIKMDALPPAPPEVVPDVTVDKAYSFEVGERRFEAIWTPDGEATDSLCVWLPRERIVFTGNQFGPVWCAMPNLMTMRGDKPRLVRDYLASLERVRDLGADLLVTGHGAPIVGADRIRADLDRMHAAVSWLRDYTWAGMNAGQSVHQLMHEVAVPEAIRIGEFHGKAAWNVRAIWEEYAGWFHYDATTSLDGVPRSSVAADLAELAGGAQALAARAGQKLTQSKPLEALHLVDIALGAAADCREALAVKRDAHQKLLDEAGGRNLSETMWLRAEIADATARLA